MTDVRVRREFRSLSQADQLRYARAINRMQQGAQSSPYFRLAAMHGWPSNLCAHRKQTFPTWHRPYLLAFERAVQQADRELGGDGRIMLPYWDWLNQPAIPPLFRSDTRLNALPPEFFVQTPNMPPVPQLLRGRGRLDRNTDANIQAGLFGIRELINQALSQSDWRNFSTALYETTTASSETPHDMVHGAVGWQMGTVPTSAFDPLFWLHHCNVDRLLETYLRRHPNAGAQSRTLAAWEVQTSGPPNLFSTPLAPFTNPNGSPFLPNQAFAASTTLGYTYEQLFMTPLMAPTSFANELNEMPTFVVFPNIQVETMGPESYQLHVFLVHGQFHPPSLGLEPTDYAQYDNYAGTTAIFAGKEDCENCKNHKPFSRRVNIDGALRKMKVSRYEVELFVIAIDAQGIPHKVEDTRVPAPKIEGALFENFTQDMPRDAQPSRQTQKEIKRLQKRLVSLGYLSAENVTGTFDAATETAVKNFQKSVGGDADGIVGPETKKHLIRPRFDHIASSTQLPARTRGTTLTYFVGDAPALERTQVLAAIEKACHVWEEVTGVSWKRIDNAEEPKDVEIMWHTDTKEDNEFEKQSRFDGPGGRLAHSGHNFLHLDAYEKWSTEEKKQPAFDEFQLYVVVLHELGHVLGLSHSNDAQDVMFPFYNPQLKALSKNDEKRARELYPDSQSGKRSRKQ